MTYGKGFYDQRKSRLSWEEDDLIENKFIGKATADDKKIEIDNLEELDEQEEARISQKSFHHFCTEQIVNILLQIEKYFKNPSIEIHTASKDVIQGAFCSLFPHNSQGVLEIYSVADNRYFYISISKIASIKVLNVVYENNFDFLNQYDTSRQDFDFFFEAGAKQVVRIGAEVSARIGETVIANGIVRKFGHGVAIFTDLNNQDPIFVSLPKIEILC